MSWMRFVVSAALVLLAACGVREKTAPSAAAPREQASVLLVTLDTTRFDAIGPDAVGVETPSYNALVARGRRFTGAYAAVPETLPSHITMMSGVYPAAHTIHENGRYLRAEQPLIAEKLLAAGYRTAAFVSAFTLAKRFGLARGFERYDDSATHGLAERSAKETTDAALAYLNTSIAGPRFVWVHYYDPHYPYSPPEPFRSRYANSPYRGEVAAMDEQLGRLVTAFERSVRGPKAIIVVADHGEGLGDHGEAQHGNLLYQSTMHVPMVIVAPGVEKGTFDAPVSTRRVFHTISDLAGEPAELSLRDATLEPVAGEAMKPFLDFGWQPQVMAVEGRFKAIRAGRVEVYDLLADPKETKDLAAGGELPRGIRSTLRDYPLPLATAPPAATAMNEEERKKLASLGYVSSEVRPVVRADAPRPADMTKLFELLDAASGLFVREEYAEAIPMLERILREDPANLVTMLRLAAANSTLGRDVEALAAFRKAQAIAPASQDVRTYLALHYARGKEWQKAVPLLESVLSESPDRLPALEALANVRERQGRAEEAVQLRGKIYSMRDAKPAELTKLGEMQMELGQTNEAINSFERARSAAPAAFRNDLELGVLYLAARRFEDARAALDRVSPAHPGYPIALFKRAQVSVLLKEPDAAQRIARARQLADPATRELIARERLFAGF